MQAGLNLVLAVVLLATPNHGFPQELVWGQTVEGFQFAVGFEKQEFRKGEPIIATVVIKNVGETARLLSPRTLAEDWEYSFVINDARGENVPAIAQIKVWSGIGGSPVSPGFSKTNEVRVDSRYDLSKLGNYTISASRRIGLASEPQKEVELFSPGLEIQSGAVTILVVEADANATPDHPPFSVQPVRPPVSIPNNPNGELNSPNNNSAATKGSSAVSKSTSGIAPPFAMTPPVGDTHSFSSGQKTGVGIIAGLLALVLAILWRASRRKRA